jgi:uncharacterized protein (TIGR02569 family)
MTDGHVPRPLIPRHVLDAFGLTGAAHPLPGGGGQCVRVGSVVLKPAEDGDETTWVAQLLTQAAETGFRLARPVSARDGRWVVDGWSAAHLVAGETGPAGRWPLLLATARAFHTALRCTPMPPFLARRTHRWALADRVAWGEATFEPLPAVRPLMDRLTAVLRPVSADCQLVHGDLSGNVLFADGLPPAIIDFSPYWRPAAYADAIIAVDGLLWHQADRGLLTLVWTTPEFPQMLVRALVFRLVALNEQGRSLDAAGLDELARFDQVVTEFESVARAGHAGPVWG